MDIRKIKKLIELVEESGISELEISEGEESVRISRSAPAASYPVMQQAYADSSPSEISSSEMPDSSTSSISFLILRISMSGFRTLCLV